MTWKCFSTDSNLLKLKNKGPVQGAHEMLLPESAPKGIRNVACNFGGRFPQETHSQQGQNYVAATVLISKCSKDTQADGLVCCSTGSQVSTVDVDEVKSLRA